MTKRILKQSLNRNQVCNFFLFFDPKQTLFKKVDFLNFNQIQLPIWTT